MQSNIDLNILTSELQYSKGVYKILNTLDGKFYIGSVTGKKHFRRRWQNHMLSLMKGTHVNKHLQNAFMQHGRESFKFIVLEALQDDNIILEREQYWIDSSNCLDENVGYNKYPKAICINKDFILSKESRLKLSNKSKGKSRPEWMKIKYGKPTLQLAKDGTLIKEWPSVMEAGRQLNIHPSNIKNCIKNRCGMKTYKGFIWKYK